MREGKSEGTLLSTLDCTVTSMGARTLRVMARSTFGPVRCPIEHRLDAVEELTGISAAGRSSAPLLGSAADLPRLVARLSCNSGNGRDLFALGATLGLLPKLQSACSAFAAPVLVALAERLTPLPDLADKLCKAISPEAPATIKEGGIFRTGFHAQLDELRSAAREGRAWVAALEASERERTGIRSLKVGFNQVFGYYIEITKPNLALVPADYVRRQTLANARALRERGTQGIRAKDPGGG